MKILNIGCGDHMYGTDRIDVVKTKATTKVYDIEKGLPYSSNYFDEVYAKSILEHIRNLKIFADECYRVLKEGGRIFIRTDFAGCIYGHLFKSHEHNLILDISSRKHNKEDFHYHLFVKSHLDYLFRKFRNKEFDYICCGEGKLIKHFISSLLPKKLGFCHIEMRGEK